MQQKWRNSTLQIINLFLFWHTMISFLEKKNSQHIYLIRNINNAILYEVNKNEKSISKYDGNFEDYIKKVIKS